MTDARYSSIHMSSNMFLSFDLDGPENDWGKLEESGGFAGRQIGGFNENVDIPPWLEPPRPDEEETLPSKSHPSYPYGRPYPLPSMSGPVSIIASSSLASHHPTNHPHLEWTDLALTSLLPPAPTQEIPPGMAGAKRGPEGPVDGQTGAEEVSGDGWREGEEGYREEGEDDEEGVEEHHQEDGDDGQDEDMEGDETE